MTAGENDGQQAVPPPPKIYRVMYADSGKPAVGNDKSQLGARISVDIKPDKNGDV